MGQFPITEARQELGFTPSTTARADIDVRTGAGAVGVALAGAGAAIIGKVREKSERERLLEQRTRANLDALSARRADEQRKSTAADIKIMKGQTSPELWGEETARLVAAGNNIIAGFDFSPEETAKQQIMSDGDLASLPKTAFAEAVRVISKATIKMEEERLTDAFRLRRDDIVQVKIDAIKTWKSNGVSAPEIMLKLNAAEEAGTALGKVDAVEAIKPLLIAAIGDELDKLAGLEILRESLSQLKEDGILTEAESAQTDKVLGDWIDNYVAGRDKQAKDAIKLTTIETYSDLSDKILDRTLIFSDIDDSALLKPEKTKWRTYIKGSYKDAPTQNTPAGQEKAYNATYDVATLQISPQEAYDALLETRFVKQSITDEQYRWGIDKINNPYPQPLLENVNTITTSNVEDFNRFFKGDKERNKKTNELLLAWVDSQVKEDKIPTKKEMHAMSSQFRTGDDRWEDLGQIIEVGGREWEVVGFDDDGSALVEEVD